MVRTKVILILSMFCLPLSLMPAGINIVDDARAMRRADKSPFLNINNLTNNYLPKDMPKQAVIEYLSRLGFVVYPQEDKNNEDKCVVASFPERKSFFGFGDDVVVIVNCSNGRVKSSSGQVIFCSL